MIDKDDLGKVLSCIPENIPEIVKSIAAGEIIVYPTDTVYGIGCDPYAGDAIKKIYQIKGRRMDKKLPVLGFSKKDIETIAIFDERAEKIAQRFWPGNVTLVLKLRDDRLRSSLDIDEKIAVRVPAHSCTLAILEKCRLLVGTSANRSGVKSFTDSQGCMANIDGYDIFVDAGTIDSAGESTVVDCTTSDLVILRESAIKSEEIRGIL